MSAMSELDADVRSALRLALVFATWVHTIEDAEAYVHDAVTEIATEMKEGRS